MSTCHESACVMDCDDAAALADIVEIKHIMLPPSPREFKDIYVVFELMETDLHQVTCSFGRFLCRICDS